jgi:hypothetical protein
MTTARSIITDAFREVNIIPIGREPTEDEFAEGLGRLNTYIDSLFGTDLGEFLRDWPLTKLYTAPEFRPTPLDEREASIPDRVRPYPPLNARIITRLSSPKTAYLFPEPIDGARLALVDTGSTAAVTLDANGRRIQGAPALTFLPAPGTTYNWFYRADLGEWVQITELELDDELFFPPEFDDLFITGIAIRLAPRFGVRAGRETIAVQQRMGKKLKLRYAQTEARAGKYDSTFYTEQSYGDSFYGDELLR